jgi:acyl-CoA thioesterase-1
MSLFKPLPRLVCLFTMWLLAAMATPAHAETTPATAASKAQASPERPVILVLGDSLSAAYGLDAQSGWVALLQARLDREGRRYRVANASVSGETTAGGLARLPSALERHKPAIVLIELGANDGLRALPLKAMQDNLRKLVDLSLAAGARVMIFEMRIPTNYGPAYTDGFLRSFQQVASDRKVALLPFFLLPLVGVPGAFQDDGLHPSAESQPKMLDAVWTGLKSLL